MHKCDRCLQLDAIVECYICTDFICIACDRLLFQEFSDKIDLGDPFPQVSCTTCTLAFTRDGQIHPLMLEFLQEGVK